MEREQDRVHVPASPTRCPWCKGEIENVKEVVACAACGARHHGACHQENGRCATCGATDVLVPRAQPAPAVARVKREQPLKGSRIAVTREGDALVYSWSLRDGVALFLAVFFTLMVILSPIGLWILYLYLTNKRAEIRTTHDEIEFPAWGFRTRKIRAKREDVGAIRVTTGPQGVMQLTIDVCVDRWIVRTGIGNPALRPLELEWLAQALEAWKNEA